MADAHLSLTRRALLAGACTVPAAAGAALANGVAPRHPGLDPGPMNTEEGSSRRPCSWIADQVRNDGDGQSFAVTKWHRALARFHKAEAALTAAAHTQDQALYDRLGTRHEAALQRLLHTPAPNIAALAAKLDLALYEDAVEYIGDRAAMRALKQDAHRLGALIA